MIRPLKAPFCLCSNEGVFGFTHVCLQRVDVLFCFLQLELVVVDHGFALASVVEAVGGNAGNETTLAPRAAAIKNEYTDMQKK